MRYKYKISLHGYVIGFLETDQPLERNGHNEFETDDFTFRYEPGVEVRKMPTSEGDTPEAPEPTF